MVFANNDQVENRSLHIFVEIFCQLFWKTTTFADGNVQKWWLLQSPLYFLSTWIYMTSFYSINSLMGCIESGVAFPFCK